MKKETIGKIQIVLGIVLLIISISLIVYNQQIHSTNLQNLEGIQDSMSKKYNASEMNLTKEEYFQTMLTAVSVYYDLDGQYRNDYSNLIYFSSILFVLSLIVILQGLANFKK